ncbi:MAG TPA: nuclear transport factor 2 family protein [Micromonosporaceae bacterium]|jgi:ketosteroid isomerase-like protein
MAPREVFDRLVRGIAEERWDELPDLYAEDAVVDQPFAPNTSRLEGREALRKHFAMAAGRVRLRTHNIVVHDTIDPEVIIAEFDYDGLALETGRSFRASNIQVLRVRDGRIVESRDYHDHAALAAALQ